MVPVAHILLIDDNDNRAMLSRRLIKRGYEVTVAVDASEGLAIARSEGPDLILMDMGLPVVSGWDAASELKVDDRTSTIPVIAVTAHSMSGDRERALAAGRDDFDTKPVELPRLLQKIERLLVR